MKTIFILFLLASASLAVMGKESIEIKHVKDFPFTSLDDKAWGKARPVAVSTYWSAETAPNGRNFKASLLWSDTALYVRFDVKQTEPLVVAEKPDVTMKVIGLWERDVCEIFIATDGAERRRYYEFEAAPTGEWLDLVVDWIKKEPRDWEYLSRMQVHANVTKDSVTMVMKIPMTAFDRCPKAGDVWFGNLFRQVGSGATRGYLAWRPTKTKEPQFHVPEAFGEFSFVR